MSYREVYRGTVVPAECDGHGHLSMRGYVQRLADAILSLLAGVGMDMAYLANERKSLATVRLASRFARPARAGEALHVVAGALEPDNRGLPSVYRFKNTETDLTVAEFQIYQRFMDLDARRGIELDAEWQERLRELRVDWEQERELRWGAAEAQAVAPSQPMNSLSDSVKPWEIDVLEHMGIPFYAERIDSALRQSLAQLGLGPEHERRQGTCFHTVEFDGRFLREVNLGERLEGRSRVAAVGRAGVDVHTDLFNLDRDVKCGEFRTQVSHRHRDSGDELPFDDELRLRLAPSAE